MKRKNFSVYFFAMVVLLVSPVNSFAQVIAAGAQHSIILCSDSTVWILGDNVASPVQVSGLTGITAITDGLALKKDGTVWDFSNTQVIGLTNIIALAKGYDHSLALRNDGTVWAWGRNQSGQLGDSSRMDRTLPVQVHGVENVGFLTDIVAVAAGDAYSYALKSDGTMWAWGANGIGSLGCGKETKDTLTPCQVISITNIIAIASGSDHGLALRNDGTVWSWGMGMGGELGTGGVISKNSPIQVRGADNIGFMTGIISIASGRDGHSLALKNDGTVWSWGKGSFYQAGDSTDGDKKLPVQVHGSGNVGFLTEIIAVTQGNGHSVALKNDGTVWAWGYNRYGQLGNGIISTNGCMCEPTPVKMKGICNISVTLGLLSGSVFSDVNANCIMDGGDFTVTNRFIKADNPFSLIDFYGTTDVNGNYNLWVPPGAYSVSLVPKSYWNQVCPVSTYTTIVSNKDTVSNLNFGAQISNFCPDLIVSIGTPLLRRCMKNNYSVQYWNNGTTTALKPLLRIDFDIPTGRIIPISSTLPWDSISGRSYFWHIDSVKAGQYVTFQLLDSVSCNAQLGDSILAVASISPFAGDCNLKNNKDVDFHKVIGAFDPNEKLAYSGSNKMYREQGLILPTDTINYAIHFQNTGTDTAFKVMVYDTLSGFLNISSVISGASSHPYTFELLGKGVLKWTFDNILLPDSNINEVASHGFVKFNILQRPGNLDGTIIQNSAAIVFDFNTAVITDNNVLTINTPLGMQNRQEKDKFSISIYPNPSSGEFTMQSEKNIIEGIEVYNLLGEVILKQTVNQKQKIVNLDIPDGVYFIHIICKEGAVVEKITISK